MPEEHDHWLNCPECEKRVKKKNLSRHFQRVHDMSVSDAKAAVLELEKEKAGTDTELPMKNIAGTIIVVVIIILALYSTIYLAPKNEVEEENGGNGSQPPADPYRVEFTTDDGFKLVGSFYDAKEGVLETSVLDRPTLVLVHGMNEQRSRWNDVGLVDDALDMGFNVLTYDIRGFGESIYKNGQKYEAVQFTTTDFQNMDKDIHAAIAFVKNNKVTNGQIALAGASIGANAGLSAAQYEQDSVESIVLLSPSLNYQGVTTTNPIIYTPKIPVFIACGFNEKPPYSQIDVVDHCTQLAGYADDNNENREILFQIYTHEKQDEFLHGTNLFKIDKFQNDLETWLNDSMLTEEA